MQSRLNPNLKVVEAQWPRQIPCKIALVGEAPGENEALSGQPFVGGAGNLLNGLLHAAGINRAACLVTNVFTERPPSNAVDFFFGPDKWGTKFGTRGWLKEEWRYEIDRLTNELLTTNPNVIVALGATAMWALTGLDKITKYRGTIVPGVLVEKKVLPTFHPAYVMRQYQERPTVGRDLMKALIEAQTPDLVRPEREIWIEPSLADLHEFEHQHMQNVGTLAYDIETDPWVSKQILCIGMSPSPDRAIVVPFIDKRKKDWNYWGSFTEAQAAWAWVERWLSDPTITKLAQNGNYDMQWLARDGVKVRGPIEDTMLLHHALQPELQKSLSFMASLYTNEASWKMMVDFSKASNKKDT